MENQVKIPQLPTDVMLEILSRVPAKSVGRFRTVSKLYCQLLSQPSFIKDHLRHVNEMSSFKFILRTASPDVNRYFCYPLDNNYLTSDTYEAKVNESSNQIVGNGRVSLHSCNGLFCIQNVHTGLLTLWNPTTREVTSVLPLKQAPKRICIREESSIICSHDYYFGHDLLNDDYKIVCVVCVSKKEGRFPKYAQTPMTNTIYIYSHKSGCWKEVEQAFPPYCINFEEDHCTFLHGKIHWVAYGFLDEEGTKHSQCIVSFDLATESYGTVARPPSDHPGDDLNVRVFGGELCFYINCEYWTFRGFEMWIMREYGVEQSWFQLLSIPSHNLQYYENIYYSRRCVPIFLMKSGEILLQAFEDGAFKTCIYLYNPENNNFINAKTVWGPNAYISGHIYVESLVETSISNKGQSCSGTHSPQSHLQDMDIMV